MEADNLRPPLSLPAPLVWDKKIFYGSYVSDLVALNDTILQDASQSFVCLKIAVDAVIPIIIAIFCGTHFFLSG